MGCLRHALAVFMLLCLVGSGLAKGPPGHHRGPEAGGRGQWHGEIGRFHEHDFGLWRGGYWSHGRHDGRYGWWWIVGGLWYFYPERIDPYPNPYLPPAMALPPSSSPPQYWYYCANPAGYYPYVAQCSVDWQQVQATQPPVPPPP